MTRKRAKSADQTSLGTPGTTETPRALHSPPVAYGEPRRLLSSTPFQSSSGECRTNGLSKGRAYPPGDQIDPPARSTSALDFGAGGFKVVRTIPRSIRPLALASSPERVVEIGFLRESGSTILEIMRRTGLKKASIYLAPRRLCGQSA
jgi:hypothetical protein